MSLANQISCHELAQKHASAPIQLLDVRKAAAFEAGHIPSAHHLSPEKRSAVVEKLDKSRPLYIYCYKGISSLGVAAYMRATGFSEVYSLSGGFDAWKKAYPEQIERPEGAS